MKKGIYRLLVRKDGRYGIQMQSVQILIQAQTKYAVTGGADNTMRLWEIATGKQLYSWEFLTAVKRVAWT